MSGTCDTPNPAKPEMLCQKPPHPFGVHVNRQDWWDGVLKPIRAKKGSSRVDGIVKAMEKHEKPRTGPPDPVRPTRRTDPQTSFEAAASTTEDALRLSQMNVLLVFSTNGPMSDEALIAAAGVAGLKQSTSGLRTRRNELVAMGYLANTGEKGLTSNGRATTIWGMVEE